MATEKLKSYTILALAIALALSLVGFKPLLKAYNEKFRHGTLAGIVECVSLSSNDLLSEDATKMACANSLEVRLGAGELSGLGGPRKTDGKVSLGASLQNKHSDTVFTWLELELVRIDIDGVKKSFSADSRMWIEPNATYEYLELIDDLETKDLEEFKFCDDVEKDKSCWSWGIIDARGVKIR